jgi:hypothetical protein
MNIVAIKCITLIEAPPETVANVWRSLDGTKDYDELLVNFEVIKQMENYREIMYEDKLSFPFSNRDLYISEVVICEHLRKSY